MRPLFTPTWWTWLVLNDRPVPLTCHGNLRAQRPLRFFDRVRDPAPAAPTAKPCLTRLVVLAVSMLLWMPNSTADEPSHKKDEGITITQEVTGTVVAMTKQSISVEYAKTDASYELLLPFGNNLQLEHLKSLSELKQGDTVSVQYQQTYKDHDKGEREILKTVATRLTLVRSATPQAALNSRARAPK